MGNIFKYSLLFIILSNIISVLCIDTTVYISRGPPTATPSVVKFPDLSLADYQCASMSEIQLCDSYRQFYLPPTGLYGYSKNDFDVYMSNDIENNYGWIQAICSDPNIDYIKSRIAYRKSVMCGRLMYAQVRWCKENSEEARRRPELLLCKSTCEEFANSIIDYGNYTCKNTDNTIAEKIAENVKTNWCSLFSDEEGCIKGIESESNNCGYESASISLEAKDFNSHNSCWGDPDLLKKIEEKAQKEIEDSPKVSSIKMKFIYIPIVMGVIGILTAVAWVQQNKKYKSDYSIKIAKKNDDFVYQPSKAAPSRDYLNMDNNKSMLTTTEIQEPQMAASRNSSFAVKNYEGEGSAAAALAISNNKKEKNVVYMVAIYNYNATMEDELNLKKGDRIRVEHQYDDGWGAGINETTKKFGAFPLICCATNLSTNKGEFPSRNASQKLRSRSTKRSNNSPLADTNNVNVDEKEENQTKSPTPPPK